MSETIAHEMRNPLGALTSAAQVLQLQEPDAQTLAEARAVLARQTRRLGEIVDAVQDLGRARSGRMALHRRALDLASLLREAREALVSGGDAADDAIDLDLEPAWVEGDAARLRRAITSLLDDAVRASLDPQGVCVRLRSTPPLAVLQVRPRAAVVSPARRDGVGVLLAFDILEMHGARVEPDGAGGLCVSLPAMAQALHPSASQEPAPLGGIIQEG